MTTGWYAYFLGIVQGLTEFLPISSDGHLTMARSIFGLAPDLPFEVLVHGATLLAIIVYFRRRIVELVRGRSLRYVAKLAVTVVPAVIVALTLRKWIDVAFATPALVVVTLAATGTLLLSLYFLPRERWSPGSGLQEPSWVTAWWMGCAQAAAILPGISRSGSTIVVGMWLGLAPAAAAEFSFLMGIPAIAGALVLESAALEAAATNGAAASYMIGAIAAFATGLLAIHLVFRLLASREFRWFGYYCWAAALAFGVWLWLQ